MTAPGQPKVDLPPLFQRVGSHSVYLSEIREMCVAGFPLSTTRNSIMLGLESLVGIMVQAKIEGELWLDGSFFTQKIDPDDVDILLRIRQEFWVAASAAQNDFLDWYSLNNLKFTPFMCDNWILREFAPGHQRWPQSEGRFRDWKKLFTTEHNNVGRKGFAKLHLPTPRIFAKPKTDGIAVIKFGPVPNAKWGGS